VNIFHNNTILISQHKQQCKYLHTLAPSVPVGFLSRTEEAVLE